MPQHQAVIHVFQIPVTAALMVWMVEGRDRQSSPQTNPAASAHFGTSDDVAVRDLQLELLFPADEATKAVFG